MSTYTFSGFILEYDLLDNPIYAGATTLASVFSAEASTTASYSVVFSEPNALPSVDIASETSEVLVDGVSLNENAFFSQAGDEELLGEIVWDDNGTSRTSVIYVLYDDATGRDYVFQIGGDALPIISSTAAFNDLLADITAIGVATGDLAPGVEFDLALSPYASFSAASDFNGAPEAEAFEGGSSNDVIDGNSGNDTLDGGAGDDLIDGGADNDRIVGGEGADTLNGDAGNDVLIDRSLDANVVNGGLGEDRVVTGGGADIVSGGADRDVIKTFGGADSINGDDGNDVILSGTENDTVFGGAGDDVIKTSLGDDYVDGGDGNDIIFTWRGDDTAIGGAGDDTIRGDFDDDIIEGGSGNDRLVGAPGRDTFIFRDGFDEDRILDFRSGSDLMDFTNHTGVSGLGDLSISQVGTNVVITDGAGGRIVLAETDILDIDASDFVFDIV